MSYLCFCLVLKNLFFIILYYHPGKLSLINFSLLSYLGFVVVVFDVYCFCLRSLSFFPLFLHYDEDKLSLINFCVIFHFRQLQEARARVAHLFKQTNENPQVCSSVLIYIVYNVQGTRYSPAASVPLLRW